MPLGNMTGGLSSLTGSPLWGRGGSQHHKVPSPTELMVASVPEWLKISLRFSLVNFCINSPANAGRLVVVEAGEIVCDRRRRPFVLLPPAVAAADNESTEVNDDGIFFSRKALERVVTPELLTPKASKCLVRSDAKYTLDITLKFILDWREAPRQT
uniref:Uncharacterized protein n=1 Tax=Romanomermis culicivorax TaxID=13658 RepID=A0A915KV33_ROMCU